MTAEEARKLREEAQKRAAENARKYHSGEAIRPPKEPKIRIR
jgi:hypothetical protein